MARCGNRVWETTATAGTSVAFTLLGAVTDSNGVLYRTVAQEFQNGETLYYERWDAAGLYEASLGTFNSATNKITPTVGKASSSTPPLGAFVPITWGATATNVICTPCDQALVYKDNAGSEYTSVAATFRTNIGLGTAATLDVGTTASKVVQLDGSARLPAVDGSQLINLPAGTPSVPSGSVTDWYQAAAPSGWTRITTLNDVVPIIVSAGSPGTTNAADWNSTQLTCSSHAITIDEMPVHSHLVQVDALAATGAVANATVTWSGGGTGQKDSSSTGGGAGHTHVVYAGSWRPPGAYMLLASKN